MKQKDPMVGSRAPVATKMVVPITKDAVNNHAEIELHAKSVEHGAVANTFGGKRSLVDLQCMRVFGRFHGQIYNQVELDSLLVDLNKFKGPRNKHVVCFEHTGVLD